MNLTSFLNDLLDGLGFVKLGFLFEVADTIAF